MTGWKNDRSVKRTAFDRYCSATESKHSIKTAVVCTILELPLCFPLSLNSPNFDKFTRNRPLIVLLTTRPITVMHWYPPVVVHFSCVARIQSFSCESYRCVIAAVLTLTRFAPFHALRAPETLKTYSAQRKTTRQGAIQLLLHQEPVSTSTWSEY